MKRLYVFKTFGIIFLIAFVIFKAYFAESGGTQMNNSSIDEYGDIATAQDAREASDLARSIEEKYTKAQTEDKDHKLAIFTKPKRNKIDLFVYDLFEINSQERLLDIIRATMNEYTEKQVNVLFYRRSASSISEGLPHTKGDTLLRKIELAKDR